MEQNKELIIEGDLLVGIFYSYESFKYISHTRIKILMQAESSNIILELNSRASMVLYNSNLKKILHHENNGLYHCYFPLRRRPVFLLKNDRGTIEESTSFFMYPNTNYFSQLYIENNLIFKLEFSSEELFQRLTRLYTSVPRSIEDCVLLSFSSIIPDAFTALDWRVKYSLLVLISNKLIKLGDFTEEFLDKLCEETSEQALDYFYFQKLKFSLDNFIEFQGEKKLSYNDIPSKKYVSIRKALITPSTVIFLPAELELSNRVLRRFRRYEENFLRVNLVDEFLNKRVWHSASNICRRFYSLLQSFKICSRKFEFLAFSNSQMRSHSCWMFHSVNEMTADELRADLGDFSKIRNVGKYAARIGLCLSSTHFSIGVNPSCLEMIEDVSNSTFVFSDGVGRISEDLFSKVKEAGNCKEETSAIQIRLGGFKGVLVLHPGITNQIQLRPSMNKFEAEPSALEVCAFALFRPGYLNKQIINLLSELGVSNDVFMKLQDNMIDSMNGMFKSEERALECLYKYSDKHFSKEAVRLLEQGIKIEAEPFLKMFLRAFYKKKTKELKTKTRIYIPKSALLMGVMDEYAVLSYGEIYLNLSEHGVITGPVVVAKNPCFHPGDLRVLTGIDIPELSHMKNVLVFPQQGQRPHPIECSGSDLDGDLYFVSWNEVIMPHLRNCEPLDYTPAPEEIKDNIGIAEVIDFFIRYISNENLGVIANAHLGLSDKLGIFHEKCIELATLHSVAVDYPKTAKPAILKKELRITEYPDFMGKPPERSYKSEKILGKLYRVFIEETEAAPPPIYVKDEYLADGWEECLENARAIYLMYSREMTRFEKRYFALDEFDAWVGYIDSTQGRYQESELTQRLREHMKALKMKVWAEIYKFPLSERRKNASALYYLAYSQGKYICLPWIVSDYLLS